LFRLYPILGFSETIGCRTMRHADLHPWRDPTQADFPQWKSLFDGLQRLLRPGGTDGARARELAETTWKRIHDPHEPVHALVAEQGARLVGLTHFLYHAPRSPMQSLLPADLFTATRAPGAGCWQGADRIGVRTARQAWGRRACIGRPHETECDGAARVRPGRERSGFIVYRHPLV
jgi:hypothetical protein